MAVTFSEQSTTTFPQPAAGGRMTFIDADGDGDLDILYQTGANGTGYQYAQANGDGTYTIIALASSPFAGLTIPDHNGANFHVGDIDGDGDFDLWVGNPVTVATTGSYFRNDGGTFVDASETTFPTPTASSRVVMGDFDGDGDADMLYQTVGNGTAFQYARSNGDGTYTLLAQGSSPFAGVTLLDNGGGTHYAGDFDGDGDLDLWAASASTTGEFYINNGNGTFSESDSSTFPAPAAATRVAVGDFDSDGDDDILYQTAGDGSVWQYAQSNGDGTMTILSQASSPFAGVTFVNHNGSNSLVGDVDGDGDDDLIVTGNGTQGEFYLANGKPPEIASTTPADNATGVAVGANIVITFDESVVKGSGNILIVRASDDTVIETISVGSAQVSGSGTTWTINPSSDLAGLTGYYILMDDGTFVDVDGSIFFGIDDETTLSFTTAAANTAPTFTNLNGDTAAFTEDVSGAVRLDVGGNATVADTDSANLDTGTLTVTITAGGTAAQDVLSVANIGNGAGQIGVSGANISFAGTQIATFTGGTGGAALVITLDPDATPAAVQALVRALQYNNTSNTPSTATRTVTVVLTDGDGGTAATQTTSVTVAATNDAASVVSGDTPTFTEGGAAVAVSPNLTITDVDSANMTGATIVITDFVSGDVLTFVNQNGITGSYNSSTGELTLSGSSSVANYQAALRSITFSNPGDANVGGTDLSRTVSFVVTDGTASNSATSTVTIDNAAGPTPGDDDLDGTTGDDSLTGLGGEDILDGGDGEDYLDGGDDNDTLIGGDGNDYLKGGAGADDMTGGTGDDVYVVDDAGDTTDETGGDGEDRVHTRIDWTLGDDIEDLTLGSAGGAIDGIGNALDNDIVGNAFDNVISGLDGEDVLTGGGGDDDMYGGNNDDVLDGGNNDDFLDGGAGADDLAGGNGNDYLRGDAGDDTMAGGAGDDFYAVESTGDVITENADEGTDRVWSRVAWTLGANFEDLTLGAAAGAANGTGNSLNNVITGNASNNTLQGLAGEDTLNGAGGHDTLQGGADRDWLDGGTGNDTLEGGTENDDLTGGQGTDTLWGGDGNDILDGGTEADTLHGDAGVDILLGGDGNDFLYGGAGGDQLTGGAGRDRFVFTADDLGAGQTDRIFDFSALQGDRIDLSGIDADSTTGGDQAFTIVSAFTNVAGQLKLIYSSVNDRTQALLDVDGDGVADLTILIDGDVTGAPIITGGTPNAVGGWVL